ncbi:hypothetical protein BDE02_02G219400 [Populus trichocarpa]|nr:hypothetical protein BDE02_02G219400 [Populus trichocarpa]
MSKLVVWNGRWELEVMLNILPTLWVFMLQDKMNLVCGTTFVRSKHNRIRRLTVKPLGDPPSLLWSEIFQIRTTTFKPTLKASLKLEDNSILKTRRLIEFLHNGILLSRLTHKKSIIIMSLTLFTLPLP